MEEDFEKNGYLVIPEFISKEMVDFFKSYFLLRIRAGHATPGDPQAPYSQCFYSDPLVETILLKKLKFLYRKINIELLPTYSYTRLYSKNDVLEKHIDRESCEISVTLSLGIPDGADINPIYFSRKRENGDAVSVKLNPGDACIYKGSELWHWRPPFTNQKWYLQTFLHYVKKEGKYQNMIYDGRPFLGYPDKK